MRPESKDRRIIIKFHQYRSFKMISKINLKRKGNSLTIAELHQRTFSLYQPFADVLQSKVS